jgi:hypothetical protein
MFNQEDLLPNNQKLIDTLVRIVEYRHSTANGCYSKYWNLSNIGIHNFGLIGIGINSRKLRYYEEVLSNQIDCIKMFERDSYVYFLVEILDTYETLGDSSFLPYDTIIQGQMIDDDYKEEEEEEEEGNYLENNFPKLFESYVWLKANFLIRDLDDHYGNFGIRRNETKEVICFDPIN